MYELNWNRKYVNGLCVSIFLKDMGCYLGVIGNIQNDECLIYIFTVEVLNGNPSIFNKSHCHSWYEESRNQFLPIIIDNTQKTAHLKNQTNGNIPRNIVIDKKQ